MSGIDTIDIKTTISESVIDVFDTMLSLEAKISETGAETLDGNRFMGMVKFAGDMVGIVAIQVSYDFARLMTASMQGIKPEEVEGDEKITDLLAELSNIVGGKLKSTYTDIGLYCELTTPSITTGSDFTMQSLNMDKNEKFVFLSQEHPIIVEGLRNVGSVNFAGDITGIINFQVSDEFARLMTASMLGMEIEELEGQEEINDLIAEISNIIGGNLKSSYLDIGMICELSTPSITKGNDFIIESFDMTTYERFAFKSNEHDIFVEVGIKTSDMLQPEPITGKDIHYSVDDGDAKKDKKVKLSKGVDDSKTADAGGESTGAADQSNALRSIVDKEAADKDTVKEAGQLKKTDGIVNLDVILDIPLEITVELGRTKIPIHELLEIGPGSAVSLSTLEGESVDILANNTLIAKGVVLVKNEKYGIRITEITNRIDRIKSLV